MPGVQIPFDFPLRSDYTPESFLEGAANHKAVMAVRRLVPEKPGNALVIFGPRGVGKTHLLKIWRERHNAVYVDCAAADEPAGNVLAVDHLERASPALQEQLFHAFNRIKNEGGALLVACRTAVASQSKLLPDLRSRLLTGDQVAIDLPDDADCRVLLVKWGESMHLPLAPAVVDFLITRTDRAPEKLMATLALIARESLALKRKPTLPFVRELLAKKE